MRSIARSIANNARRYLHLGGLRQPRYGKICHNHDPLPLRIQPERISGLKWHLMSRLKPQGYRVLRLLKIRLGHTIIFACGLGVFSLLWTTTLTSSIIIMFYGFELPEYLCRVLAEAVSEELGIVVRFEKLVIPGWTSGKIRLIEVKIESNAENWHQLLTKWNKRRDKPPPPELTPETRNWSYWDVNIGKLDLKISLLRWLLGYGIFEECSLNRVRGVIDRSHVFWPPDWKPTRIKHHPGDFEIKKFEIKDAILTIKNPGFRTTFLSIFSADLPQLRKQWLFYDIIKAYSIVGLYDNCLFSLHRAQKVQDLHKIDEHSGYSQQSIFTLKNLPIEHLNRGAPGPFGWITNATIDLDLNIVFPENIDKIPLWYNTRFSAFLKSYLSVYSQLFESTSSLTSESDYLPFQNDKPWFEIEKDYSSDSTPYNDWNSIFGPGSSKPEVLMDLPHYTGSNVGIKWKVRLNRPRARISTMNSDMGYLMSALANSICTFLNSLETGISMSFVINTPISNFDGAWDIYSCGLGDVLLFEIWNILINAYEDDIQRSKQLKKLGMYSLQSLARKVSVILDYATDHESYIPLPVTCSGYSSPPRK